MNISLGNYFSVFARHLVDFKSESIRNTIASMKGNPQLIREFTEKHPKTPTANSGIQQRFESIKKYLSTRYDASFILDDDSVIQVDKNSVYTIKQGNESAPIKIHVFSDFLCSHCAKLHKSLKPILKSYSDKIYIESRNYPLGGSLSKAIARAAICADKQGKYDEYASSIYSNQRNITMTNFLSTLIDLNLNQQTFQQCYYSTLPDDSINDDIKTAQKLGIQGTPSLIINGHVGNVDILMSELAKLSQ